MIGRIITTQDCVDEGALWLASVEPRFGEALEQIEGVPLRLKPDGFAALLDAIVSQQISVAAAQGIWARVEEAGLTDRAAVMEASEEALKAVGLSRPKVRYAKALAQSDVDFEALRRAPNPAVIKELTAITGIGVWTAEIYAMFALGRADVLAAGDLALQEAARGLFELDARPSERELRDMAENWSPWKSVAARILFAYYHIVKKREGLK